MADASRCLSSLLSPTPACGHPSLQGGDGWRITLSLISSFPPPRPAATPPCREGMAGASRCLSSLLSPTPAFGHPSLQGGDGWRITLSLVSSFPHPGLRPPLPAGRGWLAHHVVSHYYFVAAGGIFVPSLFLSFVPSLASFFSSPPLQGGVAPSGVGVGVIGWGLTFFLVSSRLFSRLFFSPTPACGHPSLQGGDGWRITLSLTIILLLLGVSSSPPCREGWPRQGSGWGL